MKEILSLILKKKGGSETTIIIDELMIEQHKQKTKKITHHIGSFDIIPEVETFQSLAQK